MRTSVPKLTITILCLAGCFGRAASQTRDDPALFLVGKFGAYGFMNRSGEVVIPFRYHFAWGFAEGLAPAWIEPRRCGFIDPTDRMVIEPRFKYCRGFSQGFAEVEVENGWTFIDRSGTPITSRVFDDVHQFSDGRGAVKLNDRCGFIDAHGKFAIAARFRLAWSFSHGRAIVYPLTDWRCEAIDTYGAVVLRPDGTDCRGSPESGLVVRRRNVWSYAYLAGDGSFLTPFNIEWAEPFSEGLAPVQIDGRLGYIDRAGREAIPPQFEADTKCARSFSEGVAAVMIGRKCGFIDHNGIVQIAPIYTGASSFRQGLARVCFDGVCGYIDRRGLVVWNGPSED